MCIYLFICCVKGKGKVYRTLSLTSTVGGGEWLTPRPRWAPGTVWRGAENFASTGIRFTVHAAHSESLYQLRYPGQAICLLH
jgi:hypothetical protein